MTRGSLDDLRADRKSTTMGNAVVHFEIIGRKPAALKEFYRALFGWEPDPDSPVAPQVSDAGAYGFIASSATAGGSAIPGGIGGGPSFRPHALFYVGVPNVAAALEKAVSLGASRVMGPAANPNGKLVVGHFADPEGNLIGVAGPA
jgi:predicted enzyme related to lactoylglutathione lyase